MRRRGGRCANCCGCPVNSKNSNSSWNSQSSSNSNSNPRSDNQPAVISKPVQTDKPAESDTDSEESAVHDDHRYSRKQRQTVIEDACLPPLPELPDSDVEDFRSVTEGDIGMMECHLQSDHSEVTSDNEVEIGTLDVQECTEVHIEPPPAPTESSAVPKAPDKADREECYILRRNVAKPDSLGFGTALKQSTKKRLKTPRKRE